MTEDLTPFCRGVEGRRACATCAGKIPSDQPITRRIALHQPWPFEPCPHYASYPAGEKTTESQL